MKKILIVVGVVVLLAVGGRVYWAYQQVKSDEQKIVSQVNTTENSNSISATDVNSVGIEEISTGGNNAGPSCQYEINPEVEPCRHVEITYKTELSDNIKNSTYIVGVNSNSDQNGWHNSYFVSQPILGVRFLGVGQSIIKREA